ncbi:hypothetical protein N2152v2_002899 [Parachlorella kessleri]
MVFLHGVKSSSATYTELAQQAINNYSSVTGQPWQAVLVDLPGHGASWPPEDPNTGVSPNIKDMVETVLATLVTGHKEGKWGRVDVLVGHSTGGLVVLGLAERLGQAAAGGKNKELAALGMPKQVWVLDARAFLINPDIPAVTGFIAFAGALQSVPQPYESVDDLVKAVLALQKASGMGEAEAPWLRPVCFSTMKPNPSGPGYVRQYDAETITQMMRSFCITDFTAVISHPPAGCTIHSVVGRDSTLWPEDARGPEELALLQHQEESGAGVRLHKIDGDHFFGITHKEELLALLATGAEELKG